MRKILIVGAGQSGLHLAHGLLTNGYDVTLVTSQTSIEIRTGRPSISQLTMPTVLEYERELHLDFWSAIAPHMDRFKVHLYPPQAPAMSLQGEVDGYMLSVDRRVKMADWLEYFEDRGGKVIIHGVTLTDLDYFSRMFDLIVVAVGGGELGALFDQDRSRPHGARRRMVAQSHVFDVAPDPDAGDQVGWVASTAEAGNILLLPVLTADGPCHSLMILDDVGGPMDSWQDKPTPEEQLRRMKELLRKHTPEYYERCANAELADEHRLIEEIRLQVRNPVGVLPSGGLVLGIADVVVTSDPFSGQSWNNSTRCAKSYLESITAHGDRPFDRAFLTATFERFWEYGRIAEQWSHTISTMWDQALPPHLEAVIGAAMKYPEVADRWVQGWDYPPDYQKWLLDPELAHEYLAEIAATRNQ
ncbi:styrene monooxygenase/indole monooxygenase family protein [Actinorugispora endophytica]|uniref:Flavin-dependent dehydrogenase n=1 Tax=Actinorugispora endophytica TaxID=1605990 RepID=A0A4R6UZR8_9ACTN|nr:styrene monooxygenase/indole monooxygenase family protein [Actinorugispora endophytica]TDQ51639.1 flavin-dependent dehydrogenase [Actinorugispora endophytica]